MVFPRCLQLSVPVALAATAMMANWNDTSTGVDLDKLPRFALTKIRMGTPYKGQQATFDGITVVPNLQPAWQTVEISGRGKSGKRWKAHACADCFAEIWRVDLDHNGEPDYVFTGSGPLFNGRITPLFSVTVLLMDRDRLPVPFFTPLYFDDAIKRFVDLDRDGKPEFLISTYDERVSDPMVGAFCSGHWVSQVYRFENAQVREHKGGLGNLTFPFIHDWSYGADCDPQEKPLEKQSPAIGNYEDFERLTRIRSLKESRAVVDPVGGCESVDPETVVYDHGGVREMEFFILGSQYQYDLLKQIMADGASVRLRGRRFSSNSCSVRILWATK